MPRFEVPTPDGRVVVVNAPEGATLEDAKQYVTAKMSIGSQEDYERQLAESYRREAPEPIPEDIGFFGNLGGGLANGVLGLYQQAAYGVASTLDAEAEKEMRESVDAFVDPLKFETEEDSVVAGLGEAIGSIAGAVPLAVVGKPAALIGGAALFGAAGRGEQATRSLEAGATQEQRDTAENLGTLVGMLDVVPLGRIFKSMRIPHSEKVLESLSPREVKGIKDRIRNAATTGGLEGAQEVISGIAQNTIEREIYNPEASLLGDSLEQGAYGAGAGATLQGIADLISGRRRAGTAPTTEVEPEAEQGILALSQAEPFVPRTAPDGSVFTTQADYDAYIANQEAAQAERVPEAEEAFDARPETERKSESVAEMITRGEQEQAEAEREAAIQAGEQREQQRADRRVNRKVRGQPAQQDMFALELEQEQRKRGDVVTEQEAQTEQDRIFAELIEEPTIEGRQPEQLDFLAEQAATPVELSRPDTAESAEALRIENEKRIQQEISAEQTEALADQVKPKAQTGSQLTPEQQAKRQAELDKAFKAKQARNQRAKQVAQQARAKAQGKDGKTPVATAVGQQLAQPTQDAPITPIYTGKSVPTAKPAQPTKSRAAKTSVVTPEVVPVQQTTAPTVEQPSETTKPKDTTTPKKTVIKKAQQPTEADQAKIRQREAVVNTAKKQKDAKVYFDKPLTYNQAVEHIAYDIVYNEPTHTAKNTNKEDLPILSGQGSAKAKATLEWAESQGIVDLPKDIKDRVKYYEAQQRTSERSIRRVESQDKRRVVEENALAVEQEQAKEAKRQAREEAKQTTVGVVTKGEPTPEVAIEEKRLEKKRRDEVTGKAKAKPKTQAQKEQEQIDAEIDKLFGADPDAIIDDAGVSDVPVDLEARYDDIKAAHYRIQGIDEYNIVEDGEGNFYHPVDPSLAPAIESGDPARIFGALRLSVGKDRQLLKIIDALEKNLGNTKIKGVQSVKRPDGSEAMGRFSGKRDTIEISLDKRLEPILAHTVMHEITHAVTLNTMSNPSHPMTKKMDNLFAQVKPEILNYYGATNVREFVAEAFSNPQFRQELGQINYTDKGQRKNALYEFLTDTIEFLRKLIGFPARKGTALDSAESIIYEMVAPNTTQKDAGVEYMASAMGRSGAVLKDAFENIPEWTSQKKRDIDYMVGRSDLGTKVKSAFFSLLPLRPIVELADKHVPNAARLDDIIQEQSGFVTTQIQSVDAIANRLSKWADKNREMAQKLNNVIYKSTFMRVDPTRPRSFYEGKQDKSGNDLAKDWDEVNAMWKQLDPDAQKYYKQLRNAYKNYFLQIKDLLNNRLEGEIPDAKERQSVVQRLYDKITDGGNIDPYFPLKRRGKFWLSYTGPDGELYKESFESPAQRDDARTVLQGVDGVKDINEYEKVSMSRYDKDIPVGFITDVRKVLDSKIGDTDEKAAAKNDIINLFLQSIPERSFLQSFNVRADVRGFEGDDTYTRKDGNGDFKFDALDAFRSSSVSLVHQLSTMKYGGQISKLQGEMREAVETKMQDPSIPSIEKGKSKFYYEELRKRADFARNPQVGKFAQVATSFGFGMTLGANISSALVNFAQIPTVVAPYLGAEYGYRDTLKAIGEATKLIGGSGTKQQVQVVSPDLTKDGKTQFTTEEVDAVWGIDNYDFSDPNLSPEIKELEPLVKHARAMGQLNRSVTYDVLDMDAADSPMAKVNQVSGFVFHHAERVNRQVALIAAYKLAIKNGKPPEEAAKEAVYVTEITNGGTAAGSAPRIAQNDIGKVAFLFKRYGITMYALLGKIANGAFSKNSTDKDKAIARKQLAGIYGATGLLAGVAGMPLFGALTMVADLFLDDEEMDAEGHVREFLGGGLYHGALNATLGVDIASRVGLSDLIFREPLVVREGQPFLYTALEALGGPVVGVTLGIDRGVRMLADGESRGFEQILPASVRNLTKAGRFSQEGALTLRGDPIVEDIGVGNILAQALGFAPSEYIYQLERNSKLKKMDRNIVNKRTKLLRKYYIALRSFDEAGAQDVMQDIRKFNRRHPEVAIGGDTLRRSLKRHFKTTTQMIGGVLPSTQRRPQYVEAHEALE